MTNAKFMKCISIILLTCILLAVPLAVFADVAPPANPPGVNPQPDSDTTQVRMAAETVQIDVADDGYLGRARVTADFTMRNLGTESESMAVRFPISANDGRGSYPEIKDLLIKINGQQISYKRANYPDIRYQDENIPWAEFNVTFPVGKDVPIQVAYNLSGSGYMPYTAFYYILETGAGWKDTIGSADIILRLPYEPNPQNVVINMEIGWGETTSGGVIEGNEMRWHFDNFEPGPDGTVQNMEFSMVAPVSWKNLLVERDSAAKNPKDSEAWGRLAKAYKGIFLMSKGYRTDPGGEELYQLSIDAYEKCLVLNPKDAQWHAGFADLLAGRSYFDSWNGPTADAYRALDEIHTALQLAPNDPKVLEIAENISYMFPDGVLKNGNVYDFPWLTQTPVPRPTPTPMPILQTEATVLLDPQVVSGTYQSDILTLGNNKKLKLTLTLRPDQSAEWVSAFENEATVISKGTWKDSGKGWLYIDVEAPNKATTVINGITVEGDTLHFTGYKLYYGDPGSDITMRRLVTATPVPRSTSTPQPITPTPTPSSKPSLPFCGSAALIGVVWLAKKRK